MQNKKCRICGGELTQKIHESVQEFYCNICGYHVVTTYIDKIYSDDRDYTISIINGDFKDKRHIRFISTFCGVNFLIARDMLMGMGFIDIKGKAPYIRDIAIKAESVDLDYQINPKFPYS